MVSPTSCAEVSVQLPSPLLVPADSVAPLGTPEILIDRLSEPSVSVSAAGNVQRDRRVLVAGSRRHRQCRRIGDRVHRHQDAAAGGRGIAAVALGRGCIHRQREVRIAVRGRRDGQPGELRRVSVQLPPPLLVPADSAAPVGTPEMLIDRLSEPSVSVSAEEIDSGIAVSSLPEAAATASDGASATALTVIATVSLSLAKPSEVVIVRVSEPLKS